MNNELYAYLSSEFLPFTRIFRRKFFQDRLYRLEQRVRGQTALGNTGNQFTPLQKRSLYDYARPLRQSALSGGQSGY